MARRTIYFHWWQSALAAGTKTPVVGVDAVRSGQFVAGTGLPLYVAQAVFRTAVTNLQPTLRWKDSLIKCGMSQNYEPSTWIVPLLALLDFGFFQLPGPMAKV